MYCGKCAIFELHDDELLLQLPESIESISVFQNSEAMVMLVFQPNLWTLNPFLK